MILSLIISKGSSSSSRLPIRNIQTLHIVLMITYQSLVKGSTDTCDEYSNPSKYQTMINPKKVWWLHKVGRQESLEGREGGGEYLSQKHDLVRDISGFCLLETSLK